MRRKSVRQEDPMGCGVACVAFLLGKTYQQTLKQLPDGKKKARSTGFSLKELVRVLGPGYRSGFAKRNRSQIYRESSIIFMKRGKQYRCGHYVARLNKEWMNPWINFPNIPVKAGFQRRLPEKPAYVIFKK